MFIASMLLAVKEEILAYVYGDLYHDYAACWIIKFNFSRWVLESEVKPKINK